MKTAIATDSNSGIFEAEGKELGVFVLPMPVLKHVLITGRDSFFLLQQIPGLRALDFPAERNDGIAQISRFYHRSIAISLCLRYTLPMR